MPFTPINAETGERVELDVSPEELAKVKRGEWRDIITDRTGARWQAWGTPCGLGCHCDAEAVRLIDPAPPGPPARVGVAGDLVGWSHPWAVRLVGMADVAGALRGLPHV